MFGWFLLYDQFVYRIGIAVFIMDVCIKEYLKMTLNNLKCGLRKIKSKRFSNEGFIFEL